MEVKDLEEYLGIIVDLEKNIYLQKQLIDTLKHKISTLSIPKKIQPPIPPVAPKGGLAGSCLRTCVLCVLCLLASFIVAFVLCIPIGIFDSILDLGITDPILFTIIAVLSIGSCGLVISGNDWGRYKKQRAQYEQSFSQYQEACFQDRMRVEQEIRKKEALLDSLNQLEVQSKSTAQTLTNMYALNVIDEAYRTFPRVCTLYEYIRSGRCHALEETKGFASGGAYNLLRQEELQEIIILRLNQILQHLDAIQANQYMLYNAIQEGNQKLNNIISNINQISEQICRKGISLEDSRKLDSLLKNSELTAYNTGCIEKELYYMNRMNYFAGKYDGAGIFLRRPPM